MSRDAKVKISAFCNIPTSELLTNSYVCQHQIATQMIIIDTQSGLWCKPLQSMSYHCFCHVVEAALVPVRSCSVVT